RSATCMPINPAAPVTRTFIPALLSARRDGGAGRPRGRSMRAATRSSSALRLLQRAHLRVLAKAAEAADGNVHQARGSVEKAGAQEVEAQETKQRREHEADAGKALAASVHRRRLQRRILILLGQIGVERFRRRVQKIPIEAADRDLAQYPLVHVIV